MIISRLKIAIKGVNILRRDSDENIIISFEEKLELWAIIYNL